MVPSGRYADTVDLRLFEAGKNTLIDARTLALAAAVEASVSISLAGANVTSPRSTTLDFGTLASGESQAVQIKVRQSGPGVCHTGRHSCFYRAVPLGGDKGKGVTLEFVDAERVFDPAKVYEKK